MENRKDLTKRLIADGFKELMMKKSFEKLSIMDITTIAGIRRPSFYNHFQDKYDLLEWIVTDEVISPCVPFLQSGEYEKALCAAFSAILAEKNFYLRAFAVTGQNGFYESFVLRLKSAILSCLPPSYDGLPAYISQEDVAQFHAVIFVSPIQSWLTSNRDGSVEDMVASYLFLVRNTI